jgi:hypothetical protein
MRQSKFVCHLESLEQRLALSTAVQPPTPLDPDFSPPPALIDPMDPLSGPGPDGVPTGVDLAPPGDYPVTDPGLC